jgi:hypothetical protein
MPISTIGSNSLNQTSDLTINGVTVGKGGGAVSTNTAVGASALSGNSTNGKNTAVGYQALQNNNAISNTAVGYLALATKTSSGDYCTAVGDRALYLNTSGGSNTAVGGLAGYSNTTGTSNTALGEEALFSNTTASNNTAVGYQAGYTNITGANTTYVGYQAGLFATGNYNTAFGSGTGKGGNGTNTGTDNTTYGYAAGTSLTSGSGNTLIGDNAGAFVTTGTANTFLGGGIVGSTGGAGFYVSTGSKNTILGNYNGNQGGIDIRTASNQLVLSDGDGNPRAYQGGGAWFWNVTNQSGLQAIYDGSQFYPNPDNTTKLGYPSFRWTTVYAVTGTINTSDANQKQQIRSLDDAEKAVAQSIKGLIKAFKFNDSVTEKGDGARIHIGVIAQEVQAAFVAQGLDPTKYAMFCSDTWYEVDGKAGLPTEPNTIETEGAVEVTRLGIRYEELLAFVIAAM